MKDMKMKGYNTYHSPNDGENQLHYSGNGEGYNTDSAGVQSGLSHVESASNVKNAEMVTLNQRPESRQEKAGSYKIGT